MSNIVKIKRSNVTGKVPTLAQVEAGELALNTADNKLFYCTGTSIVQVMNKDGIVPFDYATMYSGSLNTIDTNPVQIDSIPIANVLCAEYSIHCSDGSNVHTSKFSLMHNNTTVHYLEYFVNISDTILYTVSATIVNSVLVVEITPINNFCTFKYFCTVQKN